MLEFAEETFDAMTLGVEREVTGSRRFPVRARLDDGLRPRSRDPVNDFLTVISFIGKNILRGKPS